MSNKKIIKTIVLSAIIGVSCALIRMKIFPKIFGSNKNNEIIYSNDEFGVSMRLPSMPEIDSEKIKKNGIPFSITNVVSFGPDSSKYQIVTTKYPIGTFDSFDVNELLQIASNSVIEGTDLKLIRSVDTLINSFPGISTISSNDREVKYCIILFNKNKTIELIGDLYNPIKKLHFLHYYSSFKLDNVSK